MPALPGLYLTSNERKNEDLRSVAHSSSYSLSENRKTQRGENPNLATQGLCLRYELADPDDETAQEPSDKAGTSIALSE